MTKQERNSIIMQYIRREISFSDLQDSLYEWNTQVKRQQKDADLCGRLAKGDPDYV